MALVETQFGIPSEASQGRIPTMYTYFNATDTFADIIASGYFDDFANRLYADDMIWISGSDSSDLVKVASLNGVTPVNVDTVTGSIKYSAIETTTDGSAVQAYQAPGVLATDVILATVNTVGAIPRTIVSAACTADVVTVTMSDNPAADHLLNIIAIRP